MKEKAGKRGWILFGVSVPHTQTEQAAPGTRWWCGWSEMRRLLRWSTAPHQYHHGRAGGCSRTIDSKDVKGRFVISHRRRNIGNQKKRQIKWHRTLTPRGEWWTDMMVAKRDYWKSWSSHGWSEDSDEKVMIWWSDLFKAKPRPHQVLTQAQIQSPSFTNHPLHPLIFGLNFLFWFMRRYHFCHPIV